MLRLSFNAVNVMVKLGINHKDKKNLFIFTVLQSSSNTTLKSLLVFDLTKSSGALVSRSAGWNHLIEIFCCRSRRAPPSPPPATTAPRPKNCSNFSSNDADKTFCPWTSSWRRRRRRRRPRRSRSRRRPRATRLTLRESCTRGRCSFPEATRRTFSRSSAVSPKTCLKMCQSGNEDLAFDDKWKKIELILLAAAWFVVERVDLNFLDSVTWALRGLLLVNCNL